jgi:nitrite reductase (NADH) large subunit
MNIRHQTLSTPLSSGAKLFWSGSQLLVFVATLAVIAGLFLQPDLTLDILWFVLIPILPVTFLLNPGLWRGVCPLSTANMIGSSRPSRELSGSWLNLTATVGIVLLFVLVPARRFLFNTDGPILAVVVLAVTALAFALGWFVKAKGGFCNSICPVLPVEKLYGQAPLFGVRNARCVPCSHCTVKGCHDLDPTTSARHAAENGGGPRAWMTTPFGLFAAAFPGFIFGYFQLTDGGLEQILPVYGTILGYAAISLVLFVALALVLRIPTHRLLPFLGALSVGIYYWYAAPASFDAFALPGGEVVRWILLAFVAWWLVRALKQATPFNSPSRPAAARAVTPAFPLPQAPR